MPCDPRQAGPRRRRRDRRRIYRPHATLLANHGSPTTGTDGRLSHKGPERRRLDGWRFANSPDFHRDSQPFARINRPVTNAATPSRLRCPNAPELALEAAMNQTLSHINHKGVICLFCGNSTSLSPQAEQRHSTRSGEARASIVRCHQCGKEAMYLPYEIVDVEAA